MEFYDTVRIFLNAQLNQVENREGNDDISHFLELFHFSLLIFFFNISIHKKSNTYQGNRSRKRQNHFLAHKDDSKVLFIEYR